MTLINKHTPAAMPEIAERKMRVRWRPETRLLNFWCSADMIAQINALCLD